MDLTSYNNIVLMHNESNYKLLKYIIYKFINKYFDQAISL